MNEQTKCANYLSKVFFLGSCNLLSLVWIAHFNFFFAYINDFVFFENITDKELNFKW